MLYTRKGDTGTTKTFSCDQRVSKSSSIAEALGSLDEINSFLGLIKVKSNNLFFNLPTAKITIPETIDRIQQDLFIIQAELAGAQKTITYAVLGLILILVSYLILVLIEKITGISVTNFRITLP